MGGAGEIVPPDFLQGDRYRLAPDLVYEFDAASFERDARAAIHASTVAMDIARLESAYARYRGDLFEEDGSIAWIEEHRDRLRRLSVDPGLLLGRALESTDPGRAAELYHGLTLREELNEEAHRRLMLAWVAAGDRGRALRHYQKLLELLRGALDAEPESETVAVFEKLRVST